MRSKTLTFIKFFAILLFSLFAIPAAMSPVSSVSAAGQPSPDQIIAEINAYRAANGLGTLQYNSTLASLAQAHSQYMASTGNITHTEGATSPTDRAYAAGYGGGHKIILSEIIYGGWGADVSEAITWWKNSAVHNSVMLDGRYVEIGAGQSTDGTVNYFVAEIAFVTSLAAPDSSGSSSGSGDNSGGDSASATDEGDVIVYSPVTIATPMPDGSVIHTVQSGQTLWTIAAVYHVDLQTILDLNNMTSGTWVYPGDQIIIQPPGSVTTPTPTLADTAIGEAFSSAPQASPSPLPTAEHVLSDQPAPSPLPTLEAAKEPIIEDPTARLMIWIAFLVIFGVTVGSIFFQKPNKRPPRKEY